MSIAYFVIYKVIPIQINFRAHTFVGAAKQLYHQKKTHCFAPSTFIDCVTIMAEEFWLGYSCCKWFGVIIANMYILHVPKTMNAN